MFKECKGCTSSVRTYERFLLLKSSFYYFYADQGKDLEEFFQSTAGIYDFLCNWICIYVHLHQYAFPSIFIPLAG